MLPNLTGTFELRMRSLMQGLPTPTLALAALLAVGWLSGLPVAVASPHNPIVVVLGVHEDGRPVARARSTVTQHLLHMGESVLAPALSNEDLLCASPDCLQRLARAFRADRLVGGEILPNDRNYIVRLWMLDVAQQQPSSAEEHCVECTAEQVYELAATSAGKLLDAAAVPLAPAPPPPSSSDAPVASVPTPAPSAPAPAPPPPVRPVASAVPPAPSPGPGSHELAAPILQPVPDPVMSARPAARCTPRTYTFGRGLAVGALGGLTAVGLATAVGLTATDGSVYVSKADGFPADITWNFQAQYRAAYALTALTAAGLGAALIDWRRVTGRTPARTAMCETRRSKWTFNRGIAIGSLGSLLASSLLASLVLTGLDGRSYVSDDPTRIPTPIPYHFQTAYSVGYIASAGLAVGLGLAIFLP